MLAKAGVWEKRGEVETGRFVTGAQFQGRKERGLKKGRKKAYEKIGGTRITGRTGTCRSGLKTSFGRRRCEGKIKRYKKKNLPNRGSSKELEWTTTTYFEDVLPSCKESFTQKNQGRRKKSGR